MIFIWLSAIGLVCQAQEKTQKEAAEVQQAAVSGKARRESGVGTDLAAAARTGAVHVMLAHAFGRKWSAEADAELDFSLLGRRRSTEEAGHYEEVGKEAWPYGEAAYRIGASVQYWPQKAFAGAFLSAGISWDEATGPDMTAGAGYHVRIGKRLGAGIAYEMNLLKTYRYGRSGDEIKIVMSYIF